MTTNRDFTPCRACRLQGWLCVCADAPRVLARTPLLLVAHVHDLPRTSNTVRLLALALGHLTLLPHGVFPAPADPTAHVPAGTTPLVLFPGHGAKPLTPELLAALPSPPALVVPDGNWKQASRMVKRLPLLAGAAKVSLPDRAFPGSAVRRNHERHHMSTYEAVAQALGILEGEAVSAPLLDFYRRATDRMLLVRGKMRMSDVYGGVGRKRCDVMTGRGFGAGGREKAAGPPEAASPRSSRAGRFPASGSLHPRGAIDTSARSTTVRARPGRPPPPPRP